jgi:hypothetical protein
MMAAALAARLKARGAALAAARAAALRQRIAARWAGFGGVGADENGVRLAAPDGQQARFGRRDRLADPRLLWPGDEP